MDSAQQEKYHEGQAEQRHPASMTTAFKNKTKVLVLSTRGVGYRGELLLPLFHFACPAVPAIQTTQITQTTQTTQA